MEPAEPPGGPLSSVRVDTPKQETILLTDSSGTSLEDNIAKVVAEIPVAVFSKSYCTFSIEAIELLERKGAAPTVFQLDTFPNASALQAALKKLYNHSTVPYVFIGGSFVGGCDSLKELEYRGELSTKLLGASLTHEKLSNAPTAAPKDFKDSNVVDITTKPASGKPVEAPELTAVALPQTHPAVPTLFWFPSTVDNHVVRTTSGFAVVISICGIILRNHKGMHWAVLGLFVDYCLRLAAGSSMSPLGQLARIPYLYMKPKLSAGWPKQFATFVGTMMSGLGALFLLLDLNDKEATACVFLGILAFAASLEAALDFCLGCWMFGLGIRFGLVPRSVLSIHINSQAEVMETWKESTMHYSDLAPTERIVKRTPGHQPTLVDLKYKAPKSDEHQAQDWSVIRHHKIGHFNAVLACIGLAVVWKLAADPAYGLMVSSVVWKVIATASAVLFVAFLLLYLARACLYPQKIVAEWMCHVRGNAFAVPPMIFMLFAFVINGEFKHSIHFARALFWIGAPAQLAIALIRVGNWVSNRMEEEHINAGWLIAPVGSFIAALVGPTLDADYREPCFLWFAFGLLMWIVLFTITLHRAVVSPNADERLRPALWLWVAAPAVATSAYVSLQGFAGQNSAPIFDFQAKNLFFFALSLAMVLSWGWVRGFFGRPHPFSMSGDWMFVFPLDALAIATIQYQGSVRGNFSKGMGYTALAISSGAVIVALFHTISATLLGQVFRNDAKWGPLSFNKCIHEALREWIPKWRIVCAGMRPELKAASSVTEFISMFRTFSLIHTEHSRHEDDVIFKTVDTYFPGVRQPFHEEHAHHHEVLAKWEALCIELEGCEVEERRAEIVAQFKEDLPSMADDILLHLRHEEDHMMPIARKHLPLAVQKDIVRKVWETSTISAWEVYLPWAVTNIPRLQQRIVFIRSLLWAMPERAQLIGRLVALNVEPVVWARISERVPEIIPRGVPGWTRYY